ncbi:MAG: LPD38 domain-containing protein [Alphaproteobacteria bacterium]
MQAAPRPPAVVLPDQPPEAGMFEGGMAVPQSEPTAFDRVGSYLFENAVRRPAQAIEHGYLQSAAGFYRRLASVAEAITGSEPDKSLGSRTLRNAARSVMANAPPPPDDLATKIYSGLGSAPVAVGEYMTGTRMFGPVVGMGAVDAAGAADQGPWETAKAFAKGALMGGSFKGTEALTRPSRALALSALGGTQAAAEGGSPQDVAASAATMGILGAVSPSGPVGVRDVGRNAALSLPDFERLMTRNRPVESNEAPARTPPSDPTPQPAPVDSAANPAGQSGERVFTPTGREIKTKPEIIEASDLLTSHTPDLRPNPNYPEGMQPRERGRAASEAQIADIAQKLDPRRLGLTESVTEGSPIIGPDRVVESGNARTLGLTRAYREGLPGAESYRSYLAEQGFDISGFREPVLVRRRLGAMTPEERIAFAREANTTPGLSMSATERAMADARAMPPALLDLHKGGDVSRNRDFVRGFMETLAPNERAALMAPDGRLSQEGLSRIDAALFARAYRDPELLAALRENPDTNIRSIGSALTDVSATLAKLQSRIERGEVPQSVDPTRALKEAVGVVRAARDSGQPIAKIVRQSDMFKTVTNEGKAALALMFRDADYKRPVSRQELAGSLNYAIDQANRASTGKSLIGGLSEASALDILTLAKQRGGAGLFEPAAEMRAPGQGRLSIEQMEEAVRSGGVMEQRQPSRQAMVPGPAYVGQVPDTLNPAAPRAKEPLRRENILRDLIADLGMPVYEGRVKGNKTLGFFRPSVGEVRIKRPSDLETAAHEIAHLLDNKFPEIRQQWLPANKGNAAIRKELSGVSYDATKIYEGFAEFVRLWSTQTAEAQRRAPQFSRWFENFVDRNPHGPSLRKTQQQMSAWFDQNALDRARSKIGAAPAINAGLTTLTDRFRQSVTDDLRGFEKMERTLTGEIAPVGTYETARLTRAAQSITEGALLYGAPKVLPDGSHTFAGKGLQQILEPVANKLDDFMLYEVGRSAGELMMQGREHLFTVAEIKAMRSLETAEFRKAFEEYQDWNKAILDFAQAKGLISPEARAKWKRASYLPFHRVGQGGNFQQVPGAWAGIKALTGGTENIRDVLANKIQNASMLISASLTNEARVKAAQLAGGPDGAKFMAKIPTDDRVVKIHVAEIERSILEALGVKDKRALPVEDQIVVDKIVSQMAPFGEFLVRGQAPQGPDVVAVLRGGKPEYWQIADPILYRSFMALNRPGQDMITRVLGGFRRIGQTSVTLTADFLAANIARDTLMGSIMSRHGFRPVIDSLKGMKSRLMADPTYRDFIANGGGSASYFTDEKAFKKHLERFYGEKGINYKTVLDTPSKLLYAAERIADAFEVSTRIGEYKRAIERGEHPRHAAYSAREVSTDFSMRGDNKAIGFLYDSVLFLKAGVNGLDRFYRGVAVDPNRQAIAAKSALLALVSAGLYGLNRGNPLYDDLEDWQKDTGWHFFVPTRAALEAWGRGEEVPLNERYDHWVYPKIWEIGALATMAERTVERTLDGNPGKLGKDFLRVLGNTVNLDFIPQVVSPLYEIATNKDRFTGRPIENQAESDLQPWARSLGTSRTMRALGEMERGLPREMQVSPSQAEALLRGFLNSWAGYGLTLSDAMFFDDAPDLRVDQYPVIRRFYQETPSRHSRHVTEFYDALKLATEARRTMRQMDKTYRPEIAAELENVPENVEYKQLTKANERMQAIAAEMRQVVNAPSLDTLQRYATELARDKQLAPAIGKIRMGKDWNDAPALRRDLLDMWTQERNTLSKSVMGEVQMQRKMAPANR